MYPIQNMNLESRIPFYPNSFYPMQPSPFYPPQFYMPVYPIPYPSYPMTPTPYTNNIYPQQSQLPPTDNQLKKTNHLYVLPEINIDKDLNSTENSDKEESKCQRKKFTREEDEHLKRLVEKMGCKKWENIAKHMPGRTGRQCRDRYQNYLIPGFFSGQWSQMEDELLLQKYKDMGSQWSKMTKYFNNRNANSLKNRWNYYVSKHINDLSDPKIRKAIKDEEVNEFYNDINDDRMDQNEEFFENIINCNFSFIDLDQTNAKDE